MSKDIFKLKPHEVITTDEPHMSLRNIYIPKTYKIRAMCRNCGQLHEYTIVQGVKVEDVCCTNCGCKSLFRER